LNERLSTCISFIETQHKSSSLDYDINPTNIPKDDSGQVWFQLAQWFQKRRFLKKLTDGRRMAIAHTGELKTHLLKEKKSLRSTKSIVIITLNLDVH
jgi:hypothetical protein